MVLKKIKKMFSNPEIDPTEEGYLEIDLESAKKEKDVIVKLFALNDYEGIKGILNALREGKIIAVIDIKSIRRKDPIELKRAVSKIKKTVDVLEGNIAGFGQDLIIATPSFAEITKESSDIPKQEDKIEKYE